MLGTFPGSLQSVFESLVTSSAGRQFPLRTTPRERQPPLWKHLHGAQGDRKSSSLAQQSLCL